MDIKDIKLEELVAELSRRSNAIEVATKLQGTSDSFIGKEFIKMNTNSNSAIRRDAIIRIEKGRNSYAGAGHIIYLTLDASKAEQGKRQHTWNFKTQEKRDAVFNKLTGKV